MSADPELVASELWTGPWQRPMLETRAAHALGRLLPNAWTRSLVGDILTRWPERPDRAALVRFLRDRLESGLDESDAGLPSPVQPLSVHRPVTATATTAQLRRLLDLTAPELDWFADLQSRNRAAPTPLRHYRYRWVLGAAGAAAPKVRLLEIPKPRLKEQQRRLNRYIVGAVPLHPAAHGSVPGRSVRSCLQPHAGSDVVVRVDLESFFASITAARVRGLLTLLGLEPEAAAMAAGLCTTATPADVWRPVRGQLPPAARPVAWRLGRRLASPHLPQGAPTSVGLANAVAYGLDHRLDRLAAAFGARYTRYVDDLIFSGDRDVPVGTLLATVRDIVGDEGFAVAEHKTAVLRRSRRQLVLSTVVNEHPGVSRPERDALRAIVHNCRVSGVAGQLGDRTVTEFRDWLRGRIAWVGGIDARQGARLRTAFEAIDWPPG